MKSLKLLISLVLLIPLSGFTQDYYTLSGVVTDSISTKTLEGIDITVKNLKTGTLSLYDGSYILYLNKGKYEIVFSAKGYENKVIKIDLEEDQTLTVELVPEESRSIKLSSILMHQKLARIQTLVSLN